MKRSLIFLFLGLVLSISMPANAGIDALVFENVAQEKRYRSLARTITLPGMPKTNRWPIQMPIFARDLRVELLRLIKEGRSDQEIIDYLVARYGDYVRYKPPFKPSTWLLWFGPLLILILAVIALARIVRAREQSQPVQDLSADESERLKDLLAENNKEENNKSEKNKEGDA